jgi:D-glycero-D-manno-heptose 1,7-bisphosphate phosphatase
VSAQRTAVFLDRDGTLVREVPGALSDPRQIELIPGAAEAVARLNRSGIPVALVTNQSAIARGWMDHERLERVHAALAQALAAHGARLDAIAICPHHPDEGLPPYRRACGCRKPEPGLVLEAAEALGADLARSWVVGDAERDLEAGRRAGARALLVLTGKGRDEAERLRRSGAEPTCAADLGAAVEAILTQKGNL